MDNYHHGYTDSFDCREYCISEAALQLRECFRMLWEQHVFWTRMVITSIVLDLPDLEANTARLLRNAPDFAKIFRCYYAKDVAGEFKRLLRDHLVIAAELVKAATDGDTGAAADAEKRWYANADEISRFLSGINPNWPYKHMRAMWFDHLKMTKAEAVAIISADYPTSVKIFDRIEKQALAMADVFADGIICQFGL